MYFTRKTLSDFSHRIIAKPAHQPLDQEDRYTVSLCSPFLPRVTKRSSF